MSNVGSYSVFKLFRKKGQSKSSPMNEARQGKVKGGDEVDHLLLDLAHAKLGRTEDNITDHQDIVFVWISVFFSFFIFQYCPFTVLQ